jgi:hypothetical protein
MEDSETLDAEYRSFVRALHPATVDGLVAVERFWHHTVKPFFPQDGEEPPTRDQYLDRFEGLRDIVDPSFLPLVHGHPDPEVRDWADLVYRRLTLAVQYLAPDLVGQEDGKVAATAMEQMDKGLVALRGAIYHAPFRSERPKPRYTGELIGIGDPLPSTVLRARRAKADG